MISLGNILRQVLLEHFEVAQTTLIQLLGLPFIFVPRIEFKVMRYLKQLPLLSPCSLPERSFFSAVLKT